MDWADGKPRCAWADPQNERYLHYHDHEWGVPVYDDHRLLEMLILESFQAGLSWACILNKREAFRQAFDGFDLDKICAYGADKCQALQQNPAIIRNRRKIDAAVRNAKVFRAIAQEYGSFSAYLWGWTEGKVLYEQGQTTSPLSDALSKDLRRRGMSFVGSTILYAYLQAVGVVWSHDPGCYLERQTP